MTNEDFLSMPHSVWGRRFSPTVTVKLMKAGMAWILQDKTTQNP